MIQYAAMFIAEIFVVEIIRSKTLMQVHLFIHEKSNFESNYFETCTEYILICKSKIHSL